MRKNTVIVLSIIVLVASFLRLFKLGEVPISLDWDEVSLGYNAYSILQTGRDEYGNILPFILRSYDDYKPGLYAYISMPSIIIFGLNSFAVRFPSALFGILTVIAIYFLIKELFQNIGKREWIASISALLLAISPWHIQFSRVAFESNVGLAFNVFGFLFFLKGLRRPFFLNLSAVFFAVNVYVYQSEKVLVPLFVFVLIFLYRKSLFALPKKYIIFAGIIGFFLAFPMFIATVTDKRAIARAQGVSVFSDKTLLKDSIEKLSQAREKNDIVGQIIYNRRFVYAKLVVLGYISHFDLNWLFIKGDFDNNRHHAPNMGLLYLVELPFLFIGVYYLLFGSEFRNLDNRTKRLIVLWFLVGTIPSSVTTGVPHAVRALNILPMFPLFISIGVVSIISVISNIKYKIPAKYLIFTLFILFFLFNFSYYLNQYFVQLNYYYAKDWQYGYKEIIEFLNPIKDKYKKIIVSTQGTMDQSHMFFLFYLKYDPRKYLAEGGTSSGGFEESKNKFSNFEFRPFSYYKERSNDVLFVGSPSDFPEEFRTIHLVRYPDGNIAIKIVKEGLE